MAKIENEVMVSPKNLIAQALSQNASIETLERLMALEERYLASKAKAEYYLNLSLLQSDMPDFKRTKKVRFTHKDSNSVTEYNYTPLGDMSKALRPLLKKYGFSYRFVFTQTANGLINCDCIATHKAGHQETTSMEAARDESGKKNNIQSIGSTRTYLQRYTLKAAFGLTSDEDDNDGRTAADPVKKIIPEPKKKTDVDRGETMPIPDQIRKAINVIELDGIWKSLSADDKTKYKDAVTSRHRELLRIVDPKVDENPKNKVAENPNLTDPTWFIQNIESMVKYTECYSFYHSNEKYINALPKASQNLILTVYKTQLKKLEGTK